MASLTTNTTKTLISINLDSPLHPKHPFPPNRIAFSLLPAKALTLNLEKQILKSQIISCLSSSHPSPTITTNKSTTVIPDSTRTITTLAALAFALTKTIVNTAHKLSNQVLPKNVINTMGPLFFAAAKARARPSGYLNTPLTVVAAGLSKWLDIYSGVLMVRVLLSWFPNIPWDRQPLSAIRDLCDPYLNLFRNIIPPIFDTLDVSPLLAFAVLGTLGSILTSSRGVY